MVNGNFPNASINQISSFLTNFPNVYLEETSDYKINSIQLISNEGKIFFCTRSYGSSALRK